MERKRNKIEEDLQDPENSQNELLPEDDRVIFNPTGNSQSNKNKTGRATNGVKTHTKNNKTESQEKDKTKKEKNFFLKKEKKEQEENPYSSAYKKVEYEKYRTGINKTAIYVIIVIAVIILVIFLVYNSREKIDKYVESTMESEELGKYRIMMPDVTGYDEKTALSVLEDNGITANVEYMYNKFFDDGMVIKCSVDPDNPVSVNDVVTVYVCKDETKEDVPSGVGYFDNISLPECPSEIRGIILEGVSVDDVNLYLTFKNNTSNVITKINYTLGFWDDSGAKIINRRYLLDDIALSPGEATTTTIELTNKNIKKITFELIDTEGYIKKQTQVKY